jgi:hypothetical protein
MKKQLFIVIAVLIILFLTLIGSIICFKLNFFQHNQLQSQALNPKPKQNFFPGRLVIHFPKLTKEQMYDLLKPYNFPIQEMKSGNEVHSFFIEVPYGKEEMWETTLKKYFNNKDIVISYDPIPSNDFSGCFTPGELVIWFPNETDEEIKSLLKSYNLDIIWIQSFQSFKGKNVFIKVSKGEELKLREDLRKIFGFNVNVHICYKLLNQQN